MSLHVFAALALASSFTLAQIPQDTAVPRGSIGVKPPPPKTSFSLEVANALSGNVTRDIFQDGWGSHDKNGEKQQVIALTLTNFSRETQQAEVVVTWLGKRPGKDDILALKCTKYPVAVAAGQSAKWRNGSGVIRSSELDLPLIGHHSASGEKLCGWRVTVRSLEKEPGEKQGRVLFCKASLPSMMPVEGRQQTAAPGFKVIQHEPIHSQGFSETNPVP